MNLERFDDIHNQLVELISDNRISEVIELMESVSSSGDRGMIRTVLMALKPVISAHPELAEMYGELSETLRSGNKFGMI